MLRVPTMNWVLCLLLGIEGLRNVAACPWINRVGYPGTNVIGSRTPFVMAYIEIYVFRGNPFQAHGLEQSYHPTQPFKQEKYEYNTK